MTVRANLRGRRPLLFDYDSRTAGFERLAAGHLLGPLFEYHACTRLSNYEWAPGSC